MSRFDGFPVDPIASNIGHFETHFQLMNAAKQSP
jgi:hypothetical protein